MAFASEYCPELGLGAFGGDGSHGLGTMKVMVCEFYVKIKFQMGQYRPSSKNVPSINIPTLDNPLAARAHQSDKDTLKVEEVLIHPDCDVDGSYDYAIVRVRAAAANPCAPRSRQASMYSLNAVEVALRTKVRNRTCMLVTNLEFEKTNTNKTVMIPVTFVDTQHCWVSSDTVDWF
ncbi:unnamed protein product, partial [Nesidiocoris tenuis]